MAKVIDITEKLNFEESPKLIIKDKSFEINNDATTILKIMGLLGDGSGVTGGDIIEMYELILPEKDRKELEKLKLNFEDFQTVVMAAVDLVTGDDNKLGE